MEEIALDLAKLSLCSQKMCNLSDDNEGTSLQLQQSIVTSPHPCSCKNRGHEVCRRAGPIPDKTKDDGKKKEERKVTAFLPIELLAELSLVGAFFLEVGLPQTERSE